MKLLLAAGAFVALFGFGTYFAKQWHDGILAERDAQWEKQLETANQEMERRLRLRDEQIKKKDDELVLSEEQLELERKKRSQTQDELLKSIPLSAACALCRIPSDRIWLRARQSN